ncbi:MAG: carboxylating nicotinate-nucleotide diphosphorylase [Dehalococcoidia bacterium]
MWGEQFKQVVDSALAEDLGWGDVTTQALITADEVATAYLVAKGDGVLAGLSIATAVFHRVDSALKVEELVSEGSTVHLGDRLAVIKGLVASILGAERVALNFLQRLSGIATETAKYVEAVSGTKALITDTRKTTPGLRILEKYAVRVGGGHNHRQNLGDGILIKDNHLVVLQSRGEGIGEAMRKARQHTPHAPKVEIEVESVEQAREALSAGADIIMLDNMNLDDMKLVVGLAQGRALIEASGGITLDNVRAVAETGVDLISIGALTHSVKALDMSLELEM